MAEPEDEDPDMPDLSDLELHRKRSNSVATINKAKTEFEESKHKAVRRKASDNNLLDVVEEDNTSLRARMKATLKQGGISDIDKIFQHVMSESKRVIESLQSVQTEKPADKSNQSFLNFYEHASKGDLDKGIDNLAQIQNQTIKSEAYYCTKHGRIKGVLTVGDTYIMYDPLYCEENDKFDKEVLGSKFQA